MSDPHMKTDFYVALEQQLLSATKADNRRRSRRRVTKRVGASIGVVAGVGALSIVVLPSTGSTSGPLAAVASAAQRTTPDWSSLTDWNYAVNTSVGASGTRSTGSYSLDTIRRSGGTSVVNAIVPNDETRLAGSEAVLGQRFNSIASGQDASHATQSTYSDGISASVLPVPVAELPTTVAGYQQLIKKLPYGSTCGEKTAHLASDVLGVSGVAPVARRALIDTIAACPGISVEEHATDPLGRAGTGISVQGDGSGLEMTTELVLDPQSGEPLSVVQTLGSDTGKLNVPAGTILQATIFKYDN